MELIGLQEYIDKHGKHLTEKLAIDILKDIGQYKKKKGYINKVFNKKVWYNVNNSTSGDILFILNTVSTKDAISYLECFNIKYSTLDVFIFTCKLQDSNFDFTPYI